MKNKGFAGDFFTSHRFESVRAPPPSQRHFYFLFRKWTRPFRWNRNLNPSSKGAYVWENSIFNIDVSFNSRCIPAHSQFLNFHMLQYFWAFFEGRTMVSMYAFILSAERLGRKRSRLKLSIFLFSLKKAVIPSFLRWALADLRGLERCLSLRNIQPPSQLQIG